MLYLEGNKLYCDDSDDCLYNSGLVGVIGDWPIEEKRYGTNNISIPKSWLVALINGDINKISVDSMNEYVVEISIMEDK